MHNRELDLYMTVQITVGFYNPPTDPASFPGELGSFRIVIDNEVLTDYQNNDQRERWGPHYDASGNRLEWPKFEYAGENLDLALSELHDAFVRFQSGEFDRYEEVPAEIRGPSNQGVVVLSFADGERARIAFQPLRAGDDSSHYPDESLRGYLVDPDELCRQLIGCYREWQRYVDTAYPEFRDVPEEYLDEFEETNEEKIAELEELVGE